MIADVDSIADFEFVEQRAQSIRYSLIKVQLYKVK